MWNTGFDFACVTVHGLWLSVMFNVVQHHSGCNIFIWKTHVKAGRADGLLSQSC